MSCSDPNPSQELRTACACQKAVNELAESYTTYQAQIAAQAAAAAIYNAAWIKYQTDYRDWESRKAAKRQELVDEMKIWDSCVLWTGVYGHDDWCQSDTGFGRQSGADRHGCIHTQGKGECKRTTTQVDEELNKWQGANPPPSPPAGGTNGTVTPCSTCLPPTGNNILCCTSVISDIAAGKNVTINAAIDCAQNLVTQAAATPTPSTPTTVPTPSTPTAVPTPSTPTAVPTPSTTPKPKQNNTLLIILIILIIIISSISSVVAILR